MSRREALTADVLSAPAGPRVGAFFDFDGTMIDGYSASAFYMHRLRKLQIGPIEAARTFMVGLRGGLDEESFEAFMALALRAWEGRAEGEMEELGERLFAQEIAGALYPEAWALVAAHQRMGHTVALASSATRFQVGPLARELGVEHILCTALETEDGLLTGRADGSLLWGREKAVATRAFAAAHDIDLDASFAYSNGAEDIPFLEAVGQPRPVNAEAELAELAGRRGWPVRDFSSRGRPGLLQLGRTVATYGGMFGAFGVGTGLGLLNRSRRQAIDLSVSLSGDVALALAGVKLAVQGEENLWSDRPAVFVFNHQSGMDMPILFKLLRREITGVAKKELERSIWGAVFHLGDVAFVDRRNTRDARRALEPAVERLRSGVSLVIAPEGTRSVTPRLGAFKKGAFHMAMQAGVPIVPIVLRNTGESMWRGSRTMRPATIDVVVHPPISTQGWKVRDVDRHVEQVRELFVQTLERWPGSAVERAVARRRPRKGTGPKTSPKARRKPRRPKATASSNGRRTRPRQRSSR